MNYTEALGTRPASCLLYLPLSGGYMKPSHSVIALIGLALSAVIGNAQGIIIPRPCPRPIIHCPQPPHVPQHPLRVKSIHVSTRINNQATITKVEQVFENETPHTIEGIYFFPLPEDVSITEFAMWEGNQRLAGEVRSRDEARRIYNEIVRSRRDPALLEYAGRNLFQASIFPIQPHSEKKIELTYNQVLRNENGTVSYRYPLGTGWRANRLITDPSRPVPVPRMRYEPENQIPRQNPDFTPSGRVSAEVEIISSVPIKGIYSPSHDISVKRDGERKARLSFEVRAATFQGDFQLFYTLSDRDFGVSLLTYREPGKDGYFMLLVSPKAELDDKDSSAKDVTFVIDTSGSMADEGKMEKAKAALRFGVNSLDRRDRFNIISFAGEEHILSERLIAADEKGKREAGEFIERMRATGGTNINDTLLAAFKQTQASERPQMVVLITDGQPTVGVTQAGKIISNAKEANRSNSRLFTFGVGYDVNTLLLDGLAIDNRGTVAYIEPKEDLEVKVSNFFTKINHPVLSEVKLDWGGIKTDLIYPSVIPDIFHGSQLVLIGRYRAGSSQRLTLTGKVNGRERRHVYDDLQFPEKQSENEFLPHLWAMRRVGHLLDQIQQNGESKELRDEIIELGTRHGIVTPYTSQLILEPGGRVAGNRVGVPGAEARTTPFRSLSGRSAVELSKGKAEMKDAIRMDSDESRSSERQIGKVGGKTFYFREGVWTDSEFKAGSKLPLVTLKFASDEYFKLAGQDPTLAEAFSLGTRILVVWKDKIYQVEE
jgi:Ca-activated chloride channel homolog